MYKYNKYKYKYILQKQLGSGTLKEYEDYKKKKKSSCSICHDDFESDNEKDIVILSCNNYDYNLNHIYHRDCISDWVNRNKAENPSIDSISCPECRSAIKTYTLYSSPSIEYNIFDLASDISPVRKIISRDQENTLNRLDTDNDFYERYMEILLREDSLHTFTFVHDLHFFRGTLIELQIMIDNYELDSYISADVFNVINSINNIHINMTRLDKSDEIMYYKNYIKLLINIIKIIIEKYDILHVYEEYIVPRYLETLDQKIHYTLYRLIKLLKIFTDNIIGFMDKYMDRTNIRIN